MTRMKQWALIASTAVLFGGGFFSCQGSTLAQVAVELFDVALGVAAGTLLSGLTT